MTVYVDELRVWGHARHSCFRTGSAHMTADTIEELHAFASKLGLKPSWFQPTSTPHYDLSSRKRSLALTHGAVFVPAREQAIKRIAARQLAASLKHDQKKEDGCGDEADSPLEG